MRRLASVAIVAPLMLLACSSDTTNTETEAATTAIEAVPATDSPPDAPLTIDVGLLDFSITREDSGTIVVTSQMINKQPTGALADTRTRVLQRWADGDWIEVAILPFRASMTTAIPACPPGTYEDCGDDLVDLPDLEPGTLGAIRIFTIPEAPPGVYRMIENPFDQGAVSAHVELNGN